MSKEAMKLAHHTERPLDMVAEQALDKMAENARELGLDYEPAQQEPVAWICYGAPGKRDIDFEEADINGLPIGTLLYTSPPARKPLTRDQVNRMLTDAEYDTANLQARWDFRNGVRQCEAAHGIKGDA